MNTPNGTLVRHRRLKGEWSEVPKHETKRKAEIRNDGMSTHLISEARYAALSVLISCPRIFARKVRAEYSRQPASKRPLISQGETLSLSYEI